MVRQFQELLHCLLAMVQSQEAHNKNTDRPPHKKLARRGCEVGPCSTEEHGLVTSRLFLGRGNERSWRRPVGGMWETWDTDKTAPGLLAMLACGSLQSV